VLPAAFVSLLLIGVTAVASRGHLAPAVVLTLTCGSVAVLCAIAEAKAAVPVAVIGWFTYAGFAHQPYGDLRVSGTGPATVMVAATAVVGTVVGVLVRRGRAPVRGGTLVGMRTSPEPSGVVVALPEPTSWEPVRSSGVSGRRVIAGLVLAAVTLPLLTVGLTQMRSSLALIDEVLLYLLVVIAVSVLGGFWPSVLAALAADLILNWYFTVPLHHWRVAAPADLLALVLFITSAVTVSSVVHLAARRAHVARERNAEAAALLDLARTVLGGDDTPRAVLEHLTRTVGLPAELYERHRSGWLRLAGTAGDEPKRVTAAGHEFRLVTYGAPVGDQARLLPAYAAQAAAACERERLRTQASHAEALAEGNRMRTALLAAVSHDLRTPLASVKAAVSTLRQTDIDLGTDDRNALLATIEQGADRLNDLIGNLLDMSRIHTGSVQPLLRPTAVEEVVLQVVRKVDGGYRAQVDLPDDLPLVAVDPGLLERAVANVLSNALHHSPPGLPPVVTAIPSDGEHAAVTVLVIDHGRGVPPDAREQMFAPFQQLGDRSSTDGVGLGLAVARGFVEAIGATLTAEDTPGGGLTMRIDLPVARPVAAAPK
jgi:two-component system sensor histidine kinase KdpD